MSYRYALVEPVDRELARIVKTRQAMDVEERSAIVGRLIERRHAEGLQLLADLIMSANQELSRLNDGGRMTAPADYFRLAILSQSTDACLVSFALIRRGFPNFALTHARTLREGHIAVLWAGAFKETVAAHWQRMDERGSSWPKSGEMAKAIADELKKEPITVRGRRWSPFVQAVGETHNKVFSHAISKESVASRLLFNAERQFSPPLGARYDRIEVEQAIDHLVPLMSMFASDSANVSAELGSHTERMSETEATIARADAWWRAHPIPLIELPNYDGED